MIVKNSHNTDRHTQKPTTPTTSNDPAKVQTQTWVKIVYEFDLDFIFKSKENIRVQKKPTAAAYIEHLFHKS